MAAAAFKGEPPTEFEGRRCGATPEPVLPPVEEKRAGSEADVSTKAVPDKAAEREALAP